MNAVFADTSFWVALVSERDRHHELAVSLFSERLYPICTSTSVFTEFANYFAASTRRREVADFIRELLRDVITSVEEASSARFDEALELYEQRPDKNWSLTDCESFLIMDDNGISQALTADHHFEQAGFEILLK
jgi:predicted nucleic acid-binding protein